MTVLTPQRPAPVPQYKDRPRPAPRVAPRRLGLAPGAVFLVALESLTRNSMRSFLATLGIIIGVGCVIAMMGLAEGTRRDMEARIRRLGSNLLSVRSYEQRQGAVRMGEGTGRSLTLQDVSAIREHCPAIRRAAPRASEQAQVKFRNRNTRTQVMGVTGDFLTIRNLPLAEGRLFTPGEVRARARVCLVGALTADDLFGFQDPIGKRLMVKGQPFRVIGVVRLRGEDWDERVWVPVTTAMYRLFSLESVERIEMQALDEKSLDAAALQVTELLRKRHRLRPGERDDFEIRNQQDALDTASETSRTLNLLLAGIASVSLLVGGIGIMNIMLVSVTERTREIGIRRAIGARAGDILWQFVVEAVVMCTIGAGVGVLFGFAACWLGTAYANWPVAIAPAAVGLSCGFAVAIGMFFGLYPAVRAARLSPLIALRHD